MVSITFNLFTILNSHSMQYIKDLKLKRGLIITFQHSLINMSERLRVYLYYGSGVFIGSLILSFCVVKVKKAQAFETRLRALEIPRKVFDYEDNSQSLKKSLYTPLEVFAEKLSEDNSCLEQEILKIMKKFNNQILTPNHSELKSLMESNHSELKSLMESNHSELKSLIESNHSELKNMMESKYSELQNSIDSIKNGIMQALSQNKGLP